MLVTVRVGLVARRSSGCGAFTAIERRASRVLSVGVEGWLSKEGGGLFSAIAFSSGFLLSSSLSISFKLRVHSLGDACWWKQFAQSFGLATNEGVVEFVFFLGGSFQVHRSFLLYAA